MKNLLFIISVLILVSCSESNKEVKQVCYLNNASQTLDLNEKVNKMTIIPLSDKHPDALFKGIDKCMYVGNRFYILDYMGTSSLTVFAQDGSFMFKVGNSGNGPGEYHEVTDFDVSDGLIYLLDARGQKINSYDMNGKFVESYSYNNKIYGVNGLIVTKDKRFLLGLDVELNSTEQVVLTDTTFKEKEVILTFSENTTRKHLNIGCFRRCGEEIIYHYPISNEVYRFNAVGKIEKTYHIAMDTDMPESLKKDYELLAKARRKGESLSYFNASPLICKDFLVTTAFYKSDKAMVCWNLADNEYALKRYVASSMSLSLKDLNFPVYMDEKRVVCFLDPMMEAFLDAESKEMLGTENLSLLSEGTCLFVVYELK